MINRGKSGDRDRHVAQIGQLLDLRIPAHHDGAGARRGVEPDDPALAERLDAFDRAPLAHRVDLERALLELGFLPALGEILDPPGDTLRVVLVVSDRKALGREEALLDGDAPRAGRGIPAAL